MPGTVWYQMNRPRCTGATRAAFARAISPSARLAVPLVVLVLVASALAGCKAKPPAAAAAATAVKVAPVERAGGGSAPRYSAQIEPASRVDVAFKVGGYVDAIAKRRGVDGKPRILQEGDEVTNGLELARVRVTDYVQKISEARAAVAQARASAEQAQLDFDRSSKLAGGGAVSPAEVDATRIRRQGAAASLDGATARLAQAQTALADTSLRAPLDGVVLKRSIEVGALAAPGTVAFSVAQMDRVRAVFGVPDTMLPRVHLGSAQSVTTEAFPGAEFQGRITRIAPSADPKSRVFEVEVTIPNLDQRLKSGMVAALALQDGGAPAESEPLVPLSSIVRSPGHAGAFAVFVVEDAPGGPGKHVARARDVELGEYLGQVIPVKRGLGGGERVVVQGAGLLSDGETVEIIP